MTCPDCDGEGGTVWCDEYGQQRRTPCSACCGTGEVDAETYAYLTRKETR